jgi:hypothetical protein
MTSLPQNSSRPASGSLRGVLILATCGAALACSLVVKPRDDVERCGTAEDCEPTGDERYVPLCKFDDENLDLDSTKIDKICVASYRSISCDPADYTGTAMENGFKDAAEDDTCTELGCSDENLGKVGCDAPSGGDCESGLELIDLDGTDFCNDPDADQPIIPAAFLSKNDLDDQHVRDQFCKSYFCDDEFVCGPNGNCQPCDPDEEYGQGGCGIVYSEGAPARIYVLGDELEDECRGEDASTAEPAVFGACD